MRLVIAYDGADFHGWQRQPALRTVQGVLEDVARRVVTAPILLLGASRTDAGVHARGQVAGLWFDGPIPVDGLRKAVNHRLPSDVTIVHAAEADPRFHPIRGALCKLYRYRIHACATRPVSGGTARCTWHVWTPLALERMQAAAARLIGTHDVAGFATRSAEPLPPDTVRTMRRFDVSRRGDEIVCDVEGSAFLYNQVRNMVGTLVEIGRGHWPIERIDEILATRRRELAGPPAPPHGLCLQWIRYAARPATCD